MRISLLALLLVLTGCSSTRTLTPGSEGLGGADLADTTVRIALADGTSARGLSISVLPDTTSWIDPASRELVRVPTVDVVRVTEVSRGKGLVQGALISGLTTAAVVGVLAYADADEQDAGDRLVFGLGIGTVYGALATVPGGAVGYGLGARRNHVIARPPLAMDSVRAVPSTSR